MVIGGGSRSEKLFGPRASRGEKKCKAYTTIAFLVVWKKERGGELQDTS